MASGPSRRRPWSDGLPAELLGVVFLHLCCPADRVYFAAVCRGWRSAARAVTAPRRALPWLALPSREAPSFFSLPSGATRRLYLPDTARGARFCGSHDGGWLVAAADPWRGFAAVNVFSGKRVLLPNRLRSQFTFCEHHIVIRSVTFSAAPDADDCLAAAHVSSASDLAFWRPGMDGFWLSFQRDVEGLKDIIYYKGEASQGFHILTKTEDILVYAPLGAGDRRAPLEMSCTIHRVKRARYNIHRPNEYKMNSYLVQSRGKLLMVWREYDAGSPRTRRCRVFEMKLEALPQPQGGHSASWVELHELPGRALFLGRGCSRAFEVSQHNGLPEGIVYYLDDTGFDMLSVLFKNAYSVADMGVYAMRNSSGADKRFPSQFTSDCSPPVWIIH